MYLQMNFFPCPSPSFHLGESVMVVVVDRGTGRCTHRHGRRCITVIQSAGNPVHATDYEAYWLRERLMGMRIGRLVILYTSGK
ncbi:ORF31 [Ictalurid herpesvirus 1]|uniref:Uncharacterized protein ORF31 n=1 Tax=Ictalurid herpesvirus 1 (strain Auburn) TaxID=766178 RepID=VG31_ICHVA|nr:ORF31 [Ictalurid herpesvirus 1]Q00162.1 RecName: Full=Uncharacterized protein ORF31 [Ictalurid herpesvirus 1 (strain Auburn)]AAA88134.1 ORF31 [Ictalurid herpesvirus 1]